MLDIHCHILPGVDDGAKDWDMAVEMARIAHEDGVRTIVATPHFCEVWRVERSVVRKRTAKLQQELDRRGIPVSVLPGNEVRVENAAFVADALDNRQFCFLADNESFLLLEQTWEGFSPDTWDIVELMRGRGTKIIMAHPERHPFFRGAPDLLDRLVRTGAVWTQVSVGSLFGEYGPEAQAFAYYLVDRGLAHTLASDAHNLKRKPVMSTGFQAVAARAGAAAADAIRERMSAIAGS